MTLRNLTIDCSRSFDWQDSSTEKDAAKFEPNENFKFLNVFYIILTLYRINQELLAK